MIRLLALAALLFQGEPAGSLAKRDNPDARDEQGALAGVRFETAPAPFPLREGSDVLFGYLHVPEVRTDPGSRWIQVPVAILPSSSPDPSPDPLIWFTGGPGLSHVTSARYDRAIPYTADRDTILFDVRGTHYARPALQCPEWHALEEAGEEDPMAWAAAAKACQERLRLEGVDLNGYRTTEVAADVVDFCRVMGYERVNLMGGSYGTKIVQVLLRDRPELVRAAVLDSTLPLAVDWETEWYANQDEVLADLFSACASDPACAAAFPDLEARFWTTVATLDAEPLSFAELGLVDVGDAGDVGDVGDVEQEETLDGRALLGLLEVERADDLAAFPLCADALARLDLQRFADRLTAAPGRSSYAMGVRMACWCAEEAPFVDFDATARLYDAHPRLRGFSSLVIEPEVCRALDLRPADPREDRDVRSEHPVLFLSGGFDPATPARWSAELSSSFPNGHHVVFPAYGHVPSSNWADPCAQELVRTFLAAPHERPSAPCIGAFERLAFLLK